MGAAAHVVPLALWALRDAGAGPEAKGRAEGEAKGRAEGVRRTLENLLRLKFKGDVDDTTIARLAQADEAQLMLWTERVLDAETLGDVFR